MQRLHPIFAVPLDQCRYERGFAFRLSVPNVPITDFQSPAILSAVIELIDTEIVPGYFAIAYLDEASSRCKILFFFFSINDKVVRLPANLIYLSHAANSAFAMVYFSY